MTAQDRGWGPPCSGSIVTIVRSDGQRLPVRAEIKVLVALLCDETERLGYNLVPGWSWGYACRKIRGSSNWSNHAWGLAVDLNAPENPMGPRTGKIRQHPKVLALWQHYGFRWGGSYSGRADDMHMEFMGTPADAKRQTAQAWMEIRPGEQPKDGEDEMTPQDWQRIEKLIDDKLKAYVGTPYKTAAGTELPANKVLAEAAEDGNGYVDGIKEILNRIDKLDVPRKNP